VADAEDLTQEVFLAAYSGRERFAGRSSITTWLLRIAVFRWRAGLRRRRVDTVPLVDGDGASTDLGNGQIARIVLAHALEQLPVDQREAFVLVRVEGLTCREAADVLGIPEGTLKFRVQRAAARLQSVLTVESAPCVEHPGKVSRNEA
jgi:RNA polymerase sigma-70 factor (ECF subfamily)